MITKEPRLSMVVKFEIAANVPGAVKKIGV